MDIEAVLENYVKKNEMNIKSIFINLKLDFFQDNELWVFYGKYVLQNDNLLSNSFRGNIEALQTRLDNIGKYSLDSLNEEYYTIIYNKIKEIFYQDAIKDETLKNLISQLSDNDIKDVLEIFATILTDPKYLVDLGKENVFNKYDSDIIEHPVFQQLLSMTFLGDIDLDQWAIIIYNHIKAIDMIKNGDIPLYHGPLLDITDIDILYQERENINYDNIPKNYPKGTPISEVYQNSWFEDVEIEFEPRINNSGIPTANLPQNGEDDIIIGTEQEIDI